MSLKLRLWYWHWRWNCCLRASFRILVTPEANCPDYQSGKLSKLITCYVKSLVQLRGLSVGRRMVRTHLWMKKKKRCRMKRPWPVFWSSISTEFCGGTQGNHEESRADQSVFRREMGLPPHTHTHTEYGAGLRYLPLNHGVRWLRVCRPGFISGLGWEFSLRHNFETHFGTFPMMKRTEPRPSSVAENEKIWELYLLFLGLRHCHLNMKLLNLLKVEDICTYNISWGQVLLSLISHLTYSSTGILQRGVLLYRQKICFSTRDLQDILFRWYMASIPLHPARCNDN